MLAGAAVARFAATEHMKLRLGVRSDAYRPRPNHPCTTKSPPGTELRADSRVHVQLARRELMLADAAVARFAGGRSMQARLAAEETYALKLADLGKAFQDAGLMAMAAESLMNLSPWDYYQVRDVVGAITQSLLGP